LEGRGGRHWRLYCAIQHPKLKHFIIWEILH
jgi:hypothetical protein